MQGHAVRQLFSSSSGSTFIHFLPFAAGAPGLGPLSMRREIIVFKDGYRTRKYCLSECTQVCALISSDQTAEIKGQK